MLRRLILAVITISFLSLSFLSRAQNSSSPSKPQTTPAPIPFVNEPTADSTQDPPLERLDTITLEGSQLQMTPPLIGETDTFPEFTREMLRITWRDGDPVDLFIIKPAKVQKPPVVLFLYGYPSDTNRFLDNNYCKTVTKYGFAAVGFVSALTGLRYHDRPWKNWFVSELQESLVTSTHDVQMILNYLASRGDMDMQHVGMFGQGSGGTIAILAAAADPRLKAVDVLDPWGDWSEWLKGSSLLEGQDRTPYLAPQFLEEVAPFDPVKWLPQLKGRVLRLQDTTFDTVTPRPAKARIKKALPAGADSSDYDSIEAYQKRAAAGGQILSWLGSQLLLPGDLAAKSMASPGH